jgi:hypothetical protein
MNYVNDRPFAIPEAAARNCSSLPSLGRPRAAMRIASTINRWPPGAVGASDTLLGIHEYRTPSMATRGYFFIVPPGVVASPFFSADPAVPAP